MEHPGKALPEGAAGIGFAFGTSGLKAFAASGAASPVRRPCPAIAPRLDFVFKGPYSPAIAFFPSKTMLGISRKRKRPISDCGAFSDERAEGFA